MNITPLLKDYLLREVVDKYKGKGLEWSDVKNLTHENVSVLGYTSSNGVIWFTLILDTIGGVFQVRFYPEDFKDGVGFFSLPE